MLRPSITKVRNRIYVTYLRQLVRIAKKSGDYAIATIDRLRLQKENRDVETATISSDEASK